MTFFEWFYKTVIVQSICVLIILASVLVIKYFFKGTFQKIETFYKQEIMADTKVSEVLEGEV